MGDFAIGEGGFQRILEELMEQVCAFFGGGRGLVWGGGGDERGEGEGRGGRKRGEGGEREEEAEELSRDGRVESGRW